LKELNQNSRKRGRNLASGSSPDRQEISSPPNKRHVSEKAGYDSDELPEIYDYHWRRVTERPFQDQRTQIHKPKDDQPRPGPSMTAQTSKPARSSPNSERLKLHEWIAAQDPDSDSDWPDDVINRSGSDLTWRSPVTGGSWMTSQGHSKGKGKGKGKKISQNTRNCSRES